MARVDTLPEMLRPLMDGVSVDTPYSADCGRTAPLNKHHVVRRGAGRLYRRGVEVPKPTVTLCGFGNNLSDADGRPYCHGLAHANRLQFRWVRGQTKRGNFGTYTTMESTVGGHWEYLLLDEPCDYLTALSMGGWRPFRRWRA